MDLQALQNECLNCRRCALCDTRTHVVFGQGGPTAEVMFVGEGPGENEDLQGEPFGAAASCSTIIWKQLT